MSDRQRVFFSVYSKEGVPELAAALAALDWELVSTGGTLKAIADSGLDVTDIADVTHFPAILDHRVMTLHPLVHGGILADPTNEAHVAQMLEYNIQRFSMVVGNLYPFGSDLSKFTHGARGQEDLIDIGGPTLIRGAAKNWKHVASVCSPEDYVVVLGEIRENGYVAEGTRLRLAAKVFMHTATYDAAIARWMLEGINRDLQFMDLEPDIFPDELALGYDVSSIIPRYGENPHQKARLYRQRGVDSWLDHVIDHSAGTPLGYLNIADADAAQKIVQDLARSNHGKAVCVIIKHMNPCGVAVADTLAEAYRLAFECDSRSAFGGIVGVNQPIDEATAAEVVAAAQADVIIAPGYAPGVVEMLQAKRKNTRILEAPEPFGDQLNLRQVDGGLLIQEPVKLQSNRNDWKVVTERQPTEAEMADAALADRLSYWCKSNAIVLVKDGVAWGIGVGQQNRVESGKIATEKAAGRATGGACGSDAFYPFPDGIEAAAAARVAVVIQPGGAQHDQECITKANELGLAMIFTNERHFNH